MGHPFHVDEFGRWSYAVVLLPYGLLLLFLWRRYRILWRFEPFQYFFGVACLLFTVLGMGFEWMAQIFRVWTFPPDRYLAETRIPLFGWVTGHPVPVEEVLWIVLVIPLFYYLYLWATLVFFDIIYVVDEQGRFYKREERWAGLWQDTHICVRPKGQRGREHEAVLRSRPPGVVARSLGRWRKHY